MSHRHAEGMGDAGLDLAGTQGLRALRPGLPSPSQVCPRLPEVTAQREVQTGLGSAGRAHSLQRCQARTQDEGTELAERRDSAGLTGGRLLSLCLSPLHLEGSSGRCRRAGLQSRACVMAVPCPPLSSLGPHGGSLHFLHWPRPRSPHTGAPYSLSASGAGMQRQKLWEQWGILPAVTPHRPETGPPCPAPPPTTACPGERPDGTSQADGTAFPRPGHSPWCQAQSRHSPGRGWVVSGRRALPARLHGSRSVRRG